MRRRVCLASAAVHAEATEPMTAQPGKGAPDSAAAPLRTDGRPASRRQPGGHEQLLAIGAAAARAGVTERALRYYQQLGLLTPCASTPGGMRRYSEEDLARVTRIRQLQDLLGLNLDEIAVVLRSEDRMAQIRHAYHREQTTDAERAELAAESLRVQQELRATVQAKRQAIDSFLADLDARTARTRALAGQMTARGPGAAAHDERRARSGRPRDPDLESRVLAAALRVYAEAGWSGFSFEAVARRACVGKAPLYLRWQSKEDLLLAALSTHSSTLPIQDSGSLRDDLIEYARRLLQRNSAPEGWAFVRIHLEASINPALHARFSTEIANPHIDGARAVLHQAIERGELPAETPVDLLLDSLYGAIITWMTRSPGDQRAGLADDPGRYAGQLVDFVLGRLPSPEHPPV
jgi:DNA-binding transcriptional MerR regulator/AcrR family transcriptional regulator